MTGSRRWFLYVANNADEFAVELDESVAESEALGFTGTAVGKPSIYVNGRRPLRPRYVNVFQVVDDVTIRRRFPVATVAALEAIVTAGSVTVDGSLWQASSAKGEERKIVPGTDSEQLDGDLDSN